MEIIDSTGKTLSKRYKNLLEPNENGHLPAIQEDGSWVIINLYGKQVVFPSSYNHIYYSKPDLWVVNLK